MNFKVLGLFPLLLAVCYSAEMMGNDIQDEDREGRSNRPDIQDYDPTFLDEILGPDYFDELNAEPARGDPYAPSETDGTIEPEVVTQKAFCTGCENEVNIQDPKIKDVALFAFNAYSAGSIGSGDEPAQSFVRVTKAKTQVVAGYKYILKLEAGYLNCSKSQYASNSEDCVLDPTKETFECDFEVVERAWDKENPRRVLFSNCSEIETQQDENNTEDADANAEVTTVYPGNLRRKRSADSNDNENNSFGKLRSPEEDDEFIRSMGTYALDQLDEIDVDNEARFLVDVLSVKKQTVSGWLYHLKLRVAQTTCSEGKGKTLDECRSKIQLPFTICNIKVLVQPWQTVTKKVTESQCLPGKMKASKKLARQLFPDEKKFTKKNKKEQKKSEILIGGPKTVEADSPAIQDLLDWAIVSVVDAQSNALHAQKVVKVLHAERQLVSGIMNKITFETGYTTCRKKEGLDRSKCGFDEQRAHNFCKLHIWEKPWLKEKQVTYSKCGSREEILKRKKRSLKGRVLELHVDSDEESHELKSEHQLGGDDHDYKPHGTPVHKLDGDDHDFKPHGTPEHKLGGDDHDYKPHGTLKRKLGGDDHDYKPHGSPVHKLGGDDHDYKPHGTLKRKLGGDDHDYKLHGSPGKLGGDDHDYKPHGTLKRKLGGDDHDYKHHGSIAHKLGEDDHDYTLHGSGSRNLGGDDHDYQSHKMKKDSSNSLIGGDDHDLKPHSRPFLGGGDHDYRGYEIAEFGRFLDKHEKKYDSPEEYKYRLGVFRNNLKKIKLLQDHEQGTAVYGPTAFADLTEEEFASRHLGLRPDLRQRAKVKQAKIPQLSKLPAEFDWRNYSAVTPVKNQGTCGSCWAFSVTGNIEGLYARKHQKLESFSEQELVDCDTLDDGCRGGLPENAYKAIQKLGGLETESAYPYDGRNEKCSFKSDMATAQVTGFVEIPQNETAMASWLVKNGPISIGINANAMQFYFGGVSHPFKFLCSPKSLDHGVLIVGYGVHNYPLFNRTLPFWTIKNSWGEHWGEQGYYRVYRGDGTCGVNQMATSAVIA